MSGHETGRLAGGFYCGMDRPSQARRVPRAFVSVNSLWGRRSLFPAGRWVMDSGAFSDVLRHGRHLHTVEQYRERVDFFAASPGLDAVVAQDWMCEDVILRRTGLRVTDHQRLTLRGYDDLMDLHPTKYVLPVLQGYAPQEYTDHLRAYGARLACGAWVGVGSVCKRNSRPIDVVRVLQSVKSERPDLRLHGFGLKITALQDWRVISLLWSCDSMAWSYAARKEGRDQHDWREAVSYYRRVDGVRVRYLKDYPPEVLSRLWRYVLGNNQRGK